MNPIFNTHKITQFSRRKTKITDDKRLNQLSISAQIGEESDFLVSVTQLVEDICVAVLCVICNIASKK